MSAFEVIGPDTDMDEALTELASEFAARHSGRGQCTQEDADGFAAERLSLAFTAAELGHVVIWTPPRVIVSVHCRWTCANCGRAVLQLRSGYPPYGSALDARCPSEVTP